ncbi:hypothetical protein ACIGXM_14405 [Kitasatospora sp. NPDC052896]|uniref:hypothetical protein n=1 Tax=Kitasatospora sp. NPDC052896 TaxID=3364061 RepID=UPI0037CAFBD3
MWDVMGIFLILGVAVAARWAGSRPTRRQGSDAAVPYCQHPLWAQTVERTAKLSTSQLADWGTAISGHAMRLLEQGSSEQENQDQADELVLAGVSLTAIGQEQKRRLTKQG